METFQVSGNFPGNFRKLPGSFQHCDVSLALVLDPCLTDPQVLGLEAQFLGLEAQVVVVVVVVVENIYKAPLVKKTSEVL